MQHILAEEFKRRRTISVWVCGRWIYSNGQAERLLSLRDTTKERFSLDIRKAYDLVERLIFGTIKKILPNEPATLLHMLIDRNK